ncbi:hypothetical protein [Ornithinimicrobium cryptoxanthini]|uniref:GNAT family N-acetyltransferase n=1 Tax=Ornithinimicrobium cryptoxanthini TaxID=2934161 RepID=A0ABY4YHM5_9MICO|nr:hypothetical protein [Ornithinimicrobium cryptoxanthini]USQ76288.1 hypothetical protein NF557_17145 [Ornithinimicrobium cryptoxanthini]
MHTEPSYVIAPLSTDTWPAFAAIAWAEYGPPVELPNIHHRKQYDATKTVDPDYRITRVFVDKRHRRQGVTELAISGDDRPKGLKNCVMVKTVEPA